jgi:hypothetical protein
MGRGQVPVLGFALGLSFSGFLLAGEIEKNRSVQVEAIERQVELGCVSDQPFNQTRVEIVEALILESGEPQRLLREARSRVKNANHALTHAEQMILKRYDPIWYRAIDQAASSVSGDGKKVKYQYYTQLMKRGKEHFLLVESEYAPQVQREISSLREVATRDLRYWLGIADRLERALHQASVCHCVATNRRCQPIELLQELSERNRVLGDYRSAERESAGKAQDPASFGK